MFEKTLARCGYCGYVWALRIRGSIPKMCPRGKKRFSNAPTAPDWANEEVEIWAEKFESYEQFRKRLNELNKE